LTSGRSVTTSSTRAARRRCGSCDYVAANTVTRQGGELILPPYRIIERSGVKVGFIGVTTRDTPYFLLSEFARQYHWLDLSHSVNRWVPELRSQGVEAIVVLAHAGALQEGSDASGEVIDEARQMDDAVDVVIAGHTHSRLDLEIDGKLVVQALSYGLAFDQVRITVDRASGEVLGGSAEVVRTLHAGIRPDSDLDALVKDAARRIAPLGDRIVGHARRDLDHEAVDRLAVDAQRAFAGADVALLHPGNTRADLERGPITYADAFDVQAYEHPLWRFRVSGEDLHEALAEQPGLLVSGSREFQSDLVYTVVANGVLAEREPFARGTDREVVGTDLEALVAWLQRGEV
jgi:5'-nucleotidase